MQLEQIAIALRPRSGWEAVDLGFGMARSWWRSCYGAFWITFLPVAIALLLALPEQPLLVVGLLWWLKPLFDRFVLHALGRHCFGAAPSLRELLGAWREVLSPGLLWSLTLARLSPVRSYLMPVNLLERQSGRQARERRGLLSRRFYGNAAGLLLVCVNLELIVQMGLSVLFTLLLQPGEEPFEQLLNIDEAFVEGWWSPADTLWYIIAVCLIEPLYVAGGFALYLNRRVILEGWDVELALKRVAARLAASARMGAGLLLALGMLAGWSLTTPLQAQAEADPATTELGYGTGCPGLRVALDLAQAELDAASDPPRRLHHAVVVAQRELEQCERNNRPPRATERRQAIVEILSDPEFGHLEQVERWRLRDSDDDEADEIEREDPFLGPFIKLLASLWQVLMWVALAILLLYLGRMLAGRWLDGGLASERQAPPSELFGLEIAPESLPQDVVGTALSWLAAGRLREALALVYRASLSQLVHGHDVQVAAGATEGDVLRAARAHLPAPAQAYLEALLRTWVDLAYAEREPPLETLRSLIESYALHFGSQPAAEVAT